jgi:hypothetical protein
MCCIILSLENIDSPVQFAQQQDVFICDLVVIVKICQWQFYTLYNDGLSFSIDEFLAFKGLLDCNHEHILEVGDKSEQL